MNHHECPRANITGTPSARKELLNLVEGLVWPSHANLLQDAPTDRDTRTVLNSLTSTRQRVCLQEHGQNSMRSRSK
jgi:hypothetical protein